MAQSIKYRKDTCKQRKRIVHFRTMGAEQSKANINTMENTTNTCTNKLSKPANTLYLLCTYTNTGYHTLRETYVSKITTN